MTEGGQAGEHLARRGCGPESASRETCPRRWLTGTLLDTRQAREDRAQRRSQIPRPRSLQKGGTIAFSTRSLRGSHLL